MASLDSSDSQNASLYLPQYYGAIVVRFICIFLYLFTRNMILIGGDRVQRMRAFHVSRRSDANLSSSVCHGLENGPASKNITVLFVL